MHFEKKKKIIQFKFNFHQVSINKHFKFNPFKYKEHNFLLLFNVNKVF